MAQQGGQRPTAAPIQRPPLLKIYGLQTIILLLASATLMLVDMATAKSTLIGGLISVLPNAWFARQAFLYRGARAARAVSQSFYRGEAGKFVMTVVLFALVFNSVEALQTAVVFLAFIAMTVVNIGFAWQVSLQRVK